MRALLSLPPHFLPYAFLHDAAFIGILAAVLVFFLIFKRPYFSAFLILVGVFEISIIARIGYSIPLELYPFGIPFITIVSGIIIPIFYVIRQLLTKKMGKLLLIFSGGVEMILGAISLLYMDVVGFPYENGFLVVHVNFQLFLLGTVLSTVAAYSIAFGTFLFVTKPKKNMLQNVR
jgi:hypothetical protein